MLLRNILCYAVTSANFYLLPALRVP